MNKKTFAIFDYILIFTTFIILTYVIIVNYGYLLTIDILIIFFLLTLSYIPARILKVPFKKYSAFTIVPGICFSGLFFLPIHLALLSSFIGLIIAGKFIQKYDWKVLLRTASLFTFSIFIIHFWIYQVNSFMFWVFIKNNLIVILIYFIIIYSLSYINDFFQRHLLLKEYIQITLFEFLIYIYSLILMFITVLCFFNYGLKIFIFSFIGIFIIHYIFKILLSNSFKISEYRILLEIESTIATQFSLKEVITKIAVLSKKIVDWSDLNFAIYEPDTDETILLFQFSKGWLDKPVKFKDVKGVVYKAIKSKQPIIINDTSKEKHYINLNENTQSEITIPIIIDNEILGVLDFEHIKDNAFSKNDIYLIKQLSEQLGHSIKISKLLYPLLNSSEKLNVSINKLFSISEEMNTVTSEITSIANNITGKSATQIEIVEKSVDSSNKVKDIGILLKNNSEKIVEINKQNEKLINESVGGIYKLIEISKVIDNFIHNTGNTIEKLISSINNITNFINIIMDISHKTNLLSINASIEAAHAGEYGKGFKVLADEIALLSEQTHKMIENISVTTDEILERTNDLYNTMGEGRDNIQTVRSSVKTAQNAISSITDVMNENFKNGNEIKKMVNNTVSYIDSINTLIYDISNITTENNSNINNIIMSFENEFTTIQMLSYDIEALKLLMNKINIVLSKFDIDNLSI